MITKPRQEQHMENKVYPWKLENQMRTSKIESQSASIARYIDIQQEAAKCQRRRTILKNAMSVKEQGTLPEIVKQNRR